ncbi:MAG: twin-arginine translocase TatA/TatE family subunit [Bacteroidota bacterium]
MNSIFLAIPGVWSIVLIIVVVLILFGGKKIPELMKGLGQGMTEFKKATKEDKEEETDKNENKLEKE